MEFDDLKKMWDENNEVVSNYCIPGLGAEAKDVIGRMREDVLGQLSGSITADSFFQDQINQVKQMEESARQDAVGSVRDQLSSSLGFAVSRKDDFMSHFLGNAATEKSDFLKSVLGKAQDDMFCLLGGAVSREDNFIKSILDEARDKMSRYHDEAISLATARGKDDLFKSMFSTNLENIERNNLRDQIFVKPHYESLEFENFIAPVTNLEPTDFATEKVLWIVGQIEACEDNIEFGKILLVYVAFGSEQIQVTKESFHAIDRQMVKITGLDGGEIVIGYDKIMLLFRFTDIPDFGNGIVH